MAMMKYEDGLLVLTRGTIQIRQTNFLDGELYESMSTLSAIRIQWETQLRQLATRETPILASTLSEWQTAIQDTEQREMLFRNSANAIGALNQSGTFCIVRDYHEGMDDLHDTCSLNNGNDTEQECLDNPGTNSWRIADNGNAVTYIDAEA